MNSDAKKFIELNKNINRGYRKLEVWQEAVVLFAFVKKKINTLSELSFKLKSQIEDSAMSVSSNIAEGYCRRFLKENIQFNTIALSSLGENYSQIFNLFNAGEIDEEWFREYDKIHYSLENKLIKLNKSCIEKLKESYDWKNDYHVREIIEKYEIV
ncbi:MAG: four helix bundle protein [Ignavibacterium sp.]|uniref:four helix bundle protein n=1 Tax=Ignavibacterium sp. TaxID=2651167 RepID=UPI0021DEDDE7|nr:four helix bundle protein [Ignavibacterium sp.]BDQ01813.1 MAG: four helix bundle protein [Ignavibacterium sp.]GIV45815.1 MAG: four helix bundle protein [Ignavibacterium sp.]